MAITFATHTDYAVGPQPQFITNGDLNSDGVLDLVVADRSGGFVSVLLGTVNGTFLAPTNYSTGSGSRMVKLGDFDNDGALDIAVTNNSSQNVSVLLGNGDGTFGAATNFAAGSGPFGLTVGDFNSDAMLDLAVANVGSNNVSVLLGNGNGTFGPALDIAVGQGPSDVTNGDFNGDGELDLAVSSSGANYLSVLIGNGDGTFSPPINFATGPYNPYRITTADVNGDGKLDLLTANAVYDNVSVLLGNGNGSFGAATAFTTGPEPFAIEVADFNDDGKLDVAAATIGNNKIAALLGLGDGTFAAPLHFDVGSSPQSLTSGDFNGDGKQDIAASNVFSGSVSVLLNTTTTPNNAPVITSNDGELAVFYPFDETGGSIAHDQQGEHDGTIIGATHVPGVTGNALQFNGSSDYVSVPDSPDWNLGSEFTIEFWANFNSVPDGGQGGGLGGVPIGQDEGGGSRNKWFFEVFSGGIGFHVNTTSGELFFIAAPFEPTPGQWYAFALTKSGSSYQFYVDGQLVGSAEATLAIPDVAAPLMIGRAEEAFYFDGQLDGVAIHHRALSPAEVQQGYQDGATTPDAISATISISENTTAVTTVTATDPDAGQTLSYSIVGGADDALFTIDTETGALAFVTAPDFEAPADDGPNNVYDVTVEVSDGNGGTDTQAIAVTVTDENEAPTITSNDGELAVFYPFDETGGSIAHDQQGEHDGTIFGATHVPGVTGNALQFNGSSDYVSVPDSPDWNLGSGDFTIEFWVNFNSIPGGGLNGDAPIAQDEGGGTTNKWLLNFNGSSIDFHFVNPSLGGSVSISAPFEPATGQWYAFALTKSGSTYQFYVDGQLVGSANETLVIPDVAAPLTIGQAEGALYFDGQLDGVAIHHRALSQAEVQQGYQDGAAAPDAISATISIPENTTAVTTVVATDPDAGQTLSYSIAGGADAELFAIDTETGALAFVTAPDFEAPADDGTNNVYDVTVEVSDGNGGLDTQAISVTVTDENENENEAPTITSNGGGDTAAVSILENATAVTTVEATDPDTAPASLSYSITGGADALKFTINSTTGALAFENAPDFEVKADAGADNVYDVTVQVSDDNGGTDTQAIAVTIQNVPGLTINGTSKADTRTGAGEEDVINGLGGNDTLSGLAGNDVLNGGAGNDTLNGGTGNDAMTGGTENDTYVVDSLGDTVTEAVGQGTDTIETTLNSFSLGSVANLENLTFTGAGNFVGTGNALSNTIRGGNGNDRFVATIGDGNDSYFGGNGVDTIDLSGTTAAATVTGGNATSAQIGSDALNGIENVIGSQGNDQITGTGDANVIEGGDGNDNINAGGGADRIIGGAGNDTMDGAGGSDNFIFAAGFGNDSITAFDADPKGGQDLLDISAFGIAGGDFTTRVTIADVGADTLVTIDGDPGQTIRLVGIGNAATVTQTDFLL